MRMLLQQRPDGREAPRFVQLMLEPDLLGGWMLVRETGQIGGRSNLGFDDWIRLDLKYIDDWSLTLDVVILFRTIPAVVKGSGAS